MAFRGGALELVNSEISYHYDDLTDIISIPGWTYSQPSATQVIASITEGGPAVGDTINFVNAVTLQAEGTAAITAIAPYTNATLLAQAQATAAAHNVTSPSALSLVTLSAAVHISGFDMMDDPTSKLDYITMTGSYLHDGLAWGFNGKGARQLLLRTMLPNAWVFSATPRPSTRTGVRATSRATLPSVTMSPATAPTFYPIQRQPLWSSTSTQIPPPSRGRQSKM